MKKYIRKRIKDENLILDSINKEQAKQLDLYVVSNCFKIEVHNKNGAWYEIVLANTYNEAKSKAGKKYPNNTHISLVSEYDKPIF